jgi:hypothetical protein
MLATLRSRNFFLLWSGGLISLMSTWMPLAALPFCLYPVTGSALACERLRLSRVAWEGEYATL